MTSYTLRRGTEYRLGGEGCEPKLKRHNEAWSVYLEHKDVFAAVLKATGPWRIEDGMDLIHDFLVDRLPQALGTYNPERGPMRPWLFTVFSRYAKRTLSERASIQKRWLSLENVDEVDAQPERGESLTENQQECIREALRNLSDDLRLSLLSYFGHGSESGNIRALGRKFNWSRHRSRQTILTALATLAAQIEVHGILTDEEMEVCRAHLVRDEKWQEIAERLQKTEHQVRSVMKRVLAKLDASITRA